jgi:hypothetical protein
MEAQTAAEFGIPFDESWYGMTLAARTQMVAMRVGREWLKNLHDEYAIRSARS